MRNILLAIVTVVFIAGCASTKPTTETFTSYRIYNVSSDYSISDVKHAVVSAAQAINSEVQVQNNLPPHPLPEEAGRFQMKNFNMMGGIVSIKRATMPGATVSATASSNSDGQQMNWSIGVFQYKGGYSVQAVMTATFTRGITGFDAVSLGHALGQALADKTTGGPEAIAKNWFDDLEKRINTTVKLAVTEKYPK